MTPRLPLTKYHQIYLVLREQLLEGRFAKAMPAEMELAKQFGVGRVTIRHAMEKLVAEELIVRVAGRGTFPKPIHHGGLGVNTPALRQPTRLAGRSNHSPDSDSSTSARARRASQPRASSSPTGSPYRAALIQRSATSWTRVPVHAARVVSFFCTQVARWSSVAPVSQPPQDP